MANGIIYKYTFSDGKVYIGQTRRPMKICHQEHLNPSTGPANKRFWEAYQALGEPTYEIIHVVEQNNEDDLVTILNNLESKYIEEYDSANPQYGYNTMTHGIVSTGNSFIIILARY